MVGLSGCLPVGVRLVGLACTILLNTALLADEVTITIDNFRFVPAILTVKAGSKVIFANHDDIPHTVVDVGGQFRSKAIDTDETFEIMLPSVGDFSYFCSLHPHMRGQIIVVP
jgi:plastocyanin